MNANARQLTINDTLEAKRSTPKLGLKGPEISDVVLIKDMHAVFYVLQGEIYILRSNLYRLLNVGGAEAHSLDSKLAKDTFFPENSVEIYTDAYETDIAYNLSSVRHICENYLKKDSSRAKTIIEEMTRLVKEIKGDAELESTVELLKTGYEEMKEELRVLKKELSAFKSENEVDSIEYNAEPEIEAQKEEPVTETKPSPGELLSMNSVAKLVFGEVVGHGKYVSTGRNKLFQFLREKGVLMSGYVSRNIPYQDQLSSGRFEVTKNIVKTSNKNLPVVTTKVTEKGYNYILKLCKEYNVRVEKGKLIWD